MKKWLALIIVSFFALFLIGLYFFYQWLTLPINPQNTIAKRFVINRGESITSIGEKLTQEQLIRHPLLFRLAVQQQGLGQSIQAGSYLLSPAQNLWQVVDALTEGTEDIWVTIPEGLRSEEIAQLFLDSGLDEFDQAEFMNLAKPQEGFLFPDTYLVPKMITATEVFNLLSRTFDQKVRQGLAQEIGTSEYSLEEAVIMASLIQREAGNDEEEMKHVAGVLWNRIESNQGLGVDATLQYISGYDEASGKWWSTPDINIKDSNSPYNTYKFAGLPPTPIANPGVAAIRSALNPMSTEDYYYLHADGKIYYARDLAGHLSNIDRYLR